MGATASSQRNVNEDRFFLVERIVASMCDFCHPPTLMMGIYGRAKDPNNPYGGCGLRIGDQAILELRDYMKTDKSIKYEFENDTSLHFFRTELKEVAYRLKTPELDEIRVVDPLLARSFKPIGMSPSKPLDELHEVLR
jgi:hypothetical protein